MSGLLEFMGQFGTEDRCIEHLAGLRWPAGYVCARCGGQEAWRLKERPRIYECRGCGHQESVTAGTIFHRTRTDLPKWFLAAYLMGKEKRGVSAKFLQRELGVAYQTAWTIVHKLRHGLSEDPTWPIAGYPEAAESFTRAALAAANARGPVAGNLGSLAQGRRTRIQRAAKRAADLAPIIQAIKAEGITGTTGIAAALNARGVPAARGGQWRAIQVRRVLARF
jgi:transposase-like protein